MQDDGFPVIREWAKFTGKWTGQPDDGADSFFTPEIDGAGTFFDGAVSFFAS